MWSSQFEHLAKCGVFFLCRLAEMKGAIGFGAGVACVKRICVEARFLCGECVKKICVEAAFPVRQACEENARRRRRAAGAVVKSCIKLL